MNSKVAPDLRPAVVIRAVDVDRFTRRPRNPYGAVGMARSASQSNQAGSAGPGERSKRFPNGIRTRVFSPPRAFVSVA